MEEEFRHFSEEELALLAEIREGRGIVLNMRKNGPHKNLLPWIKEHHPERFIRGDRRPWRNPFIPGKDGDRGEVTAKYRRYYLPHKTKLCATLAKPEMASVAWGCWCAPGPCHCGALLDFAEWGGMSMDEWFRRYDKGQVKPEKEE